MRGRTQPVAAQLPARSNGYCYEPYRESPQIYNMRKYGNRNNIIPTPLTPSGRCAGSASRQRSSSRRVNSMINGGAAVGWSLRRAGAAANAVSAPGRRRRECRVASCRVASWPCRVMSCPPTTQRGWAAFVMSWAFEGRRSEPNSPPQPNRHHNMSSHSADVASHHDALRQESDAPGTLNSSRQSPYVHAPPQPLRLEDSLNG